MPGIVLSCLLYGAQADATALATGTHASGLTLADNGSSIVDGSFDDDGLRTDDTELYLEVVLNQAATGQLARFVQRGDRFYASAATLRNLGLSWPSSTTANGLVALDDLPGLQAEYDPAAQRIRLTAPVDMLSAAPAQLGYRQPEVPQIDPATQRPGLILNYDLYAQDGDGYRSVSGWNELRLFGLGPGVWSNTQSLRMDSVDGRDSRHESVRLDTFWQIDFPDRMLSLTVGDSLTGAVAWSRATRIGGIRLARNFSLQPYRITTPLASFLGEAALPSTVDLYINGLKQSSQQVRPGQFQIDSAPALNGTGQAQMVITDINGQARVVDFNLYGTPQLLQAGLSDWSLDLGTVRREYGLRSFSYAGQPMLSASGRYGVTDDFTMEGHAEAVEGLQMAGAGGNWLLGQRGGVFGVALAGSRHAGEQGRMAGASYQWNSSRFNLYAHSLRRSRDFRDVASLEGSLLARRTDQIYLGLSTRMGQWGASLVRQEYPDADPSRFASLTWSRSLPGNGSLNFSFNRDLEDRDGDSYYLFWSMPLDRRTSVSASARHAPNSDSLTAEINRSVPSDEGGWGWRAQGTVGDNAGGQAQVSQLGRYGQWNAGFYYWQGSGNADSTTTYYASANGGLVLMGGHLQAMRRVDDAFALVSTAGVADVPVKLENRLIGHTDKNGLLLINRLNAWQDNLLSIDPMQLPADMEIETTRLQAVPASRSGSLIEFPMQRTRSITLVLNDVSGKPIAAGSPVRIVGAGDQAVTVVGQDGIVYLRNPPSGARLLVGTAENRCTATLPDMADDAAGMIDLGELTCR